MATEAPKSKSLMAEVGVNTTKGLLAGAALLLGLTLAPILHPLILWPALGGAGIGFFLWLAGK